MRHLRQGVRLVHELGQLARSVELAQGGRNGTDVDQIGRRHLVEVGRRRHSLAHDALHAEQSDADLVLQQLPDGANAPIAEVVDIVALLSLGPHGEHLPDDRHDIVQREEPNVLRKVHPKAAVQLIAPDPPQGVAPRVEEEASDVVAGVLNARRLVGAQAAKDLLHRLVGAARAVPLERQGQGQVQPDDLDPAASAGVLVVELVQKFAGDGAAATDDGGTIRPRHVLGRQLPSHLIAVFHEVGGGGKHREDLIVVGDAEGLQQERHGELPTVVDVDGDDIPRSHGKVQPRAAVRDQFCGAAVAARNAAVGEVDPGGTRQLIDDDALRPVDDERAPIRHHGELAEEDILLLALPRLRVGQADRGANGTRPGQVLLPGLLLAALRRVDIIAHELQRELPIVALNGKNLLKKLLQALRPARIRFHVVLIEPLIRIPLHLYHVGHIDQVVSPAKSVALPRPAYRNKFRHLLKDLP